MKLPLIFGLLFCLIACQAKQESQEFAMWEILNKLPKALLKKQPSPLSEKLFAMPMLISLHYLLSISK
jgi:hypothetical protein